MTPPSSPEKGVGKPWENQDGSTNVDGFLKAFEADDNTFWRMEAGHALNVIDGAYALVWWDKLEETFNILRNKERPMYMVASVDNKTVFCASESWMLTIAARRSDVKIQDIIPTVEDMLYSFYIDKNGLLEKRI